MSTTLRSETWRKSSVKKNRRRDKSENGSWACEVVLLRRLGI